MARPRLRNCRLTALAAFAAVLAVAAVGCGPRAEDAQPRTASGAGKSAQGQAQTQPQAGARPGSAPCELPSAVVAARQVTVISEMLIRLSQVTSIVLNLVCH